MLHKDHEQVPGDKHWESDDKRHGKAPVDCEDVDMENMAHDLDSWDKGARASVGETRREQLQLAVLCWLFLEKFVEIVVIFVLTLIAAKWTLPPDFIEAVFWPLIGCVVFSLLALCGLRLIPWFRRYPGCFVRKLVYFMFLSAVFFLLTIHVPLRFPILSPYFALVAAGTAGATYLLLAFIVVTHKHFCTVDAKGCGLWLYGLLIPMAVLALSQPLFLYGGIGFKVDYSEFMANVGLGLAISLLLTNETVLVDQKFVTSSKLEEFVNTPGLLPKFVTALARDRNEDMENGGVENKLFLFQM